MNTKNSDVNIKGLMMKKRYRHELKFVINHAQKEVLIRRLSGIMKRDENGTEHGYSIRSLYFDDINYSAYEEKMAGTSKRKKYRIRIYNYSDNVIKLECKEKQESYIYKRSANLSREEFDKIQNGDYSFLLDRKEELCHEFYVQCISYDLRPVVVVDYERDVFVDYHGDVRITFDDNVRSAWIGLEDKKGMFDSNLPAYNIFSDDTLVLEVKFTEYLPEYIRVLVDPYNAAMMAVSKYTLCLEKKWDICPDRR